MRFLLRAFSLVAALGFLLTGCTAAKPPANTGVEGRVTIGPTCPVVQVGQPCPDKPYPARLTVRVASGKAVARTTADADGRFRIPLPPGDYMLQADAADGGPFPASAGSAFSVTEGRWTELDLVLDSGIR